jgi:hypothetical protein
MRGLLAVLAGMVTGFVIIFAIEALGHSIYPPPAGLDMNNPTTAFAYVQNMPVGALLFIALAHFAAALFGNVVTLLVAKRKRLPAIIFSVLLIAGTGSLFVMMPHPLWFMFVDLLGVLLAIILVFRLIKSPSK